MRRGRGRTLIDAIKEISVLQHYGQNDQHVLGCLDVLQDVEYLYTVMPYCAGGDLYGKLECIGDLKFVPNEEEARHYFRQILSVSIHYQQSPLFFFEIALKSSLILIFAQSSH
jgi:serine/threonine protein kinase